MSNETVKKARVGLSESDPDNSLGVWLRLQKSLAERNGIALTTLSRDGAVIGRIESDNSICRAMRVSAAHAPLCAADCGAAYSNAVAAGEQISFKCHAGLHCFAIPVAIDRKQLVILGGRSFASTREYTEFLDNYADLAGVETGECLKNVKFVELRDLSQAAELAGSTASYHFQNALKPDQPPPDKLEGAPSLLDAQLEIARLTDQLESRRRSIGQFYEFLRCIASELESHKVYESLLAKFSEIMKAERSSLMILNEESNELALEAALGAPPETNGPVRLKLGESVAGAVLASGAPLVVRDADSDSRIPGDRPGRYKSKSFISYPITLGSRKVGVINLTDRADGVPYEPDDLMILEMMAPHLALIIDRTEWARKAEAFQQMSLTDPLTGLPNRRYLQDRLFEEVERSKRYNTPLSFMIIDVDRFKSYNDVYGHTNADRVLVKTAQLLRNSIRAIDMSARFAGDEFCIVLPETELGDAARIAERLRRSVSETEYTTEKGELMGQVTLSIGISSFSSSRQSPLAVVETADQALYRAKTRGRNCVAVYEDAHAAD
ncbi:MAG TPA: diguanylate cyclase [Blastocatellia bacterium]|nr:diguanylate cyclase [Blastocatellia bacterium]